MTERSPNPADSRTPDAGDARTAARLDAAFGLLAAPPGLSDRVFSASRVELRAARAADTALEGRLDRVWDVAPAHLEATVLAASAERLPASPAVVGRIDHAAADSVAVGTPSRVARRALLGRLAMAASFGILALTGMWATVGGPSTGPMPAPIIAAAEAPPDLGSMLVALDVGEDEFASLAALDAEMALLEAGDTVSFASVEQEIRDLLPDVLLLPSE